MNTIHETAVIYPNVTIEDNVYIGAHCIIGAPPEHKTKWLEPNKGVVIKSGSIINGLVTIDAGIEHPTVIGRNSFIMKGCHIGHDAHLKEDCILSPHVLVGGHTVICERVNMGMGSIVHQRCTIPEDCMIGMNSTITKTSQMWKNGVYIGSPINFLRWNKR